MDDEDNLKRQARRRLIGAVALVTAVVVILPMVLDREPKPDSQDIDLRIPDQDKVGAFTPNMAPAAESAPAAASQPAAASSVAAVPPAIAVPAAPAVAAQPPVENKPQPAAKPAAEKPAQGEPAVADKQEAPAHKSPPPAKAESKPAEKLHAAAKEGFVVQVGAFSNAATAKQWQEKLHKQGLHAYTEKVGSNLRVRVGPYPTREAAEKVLHKLAAQGLHPVVNSLN